LASSANSTQANWTISRRLWLRALVHHNQRAESAAIPVSPHFGSTLPKCTHSPSRVNARKAIYAALNATRVSHGVSHALWPRGAVVAQSRLSIEREETRCFTPVARSLTHSESPSLRQRAAEAHTVPKIAARRGGVRKPHRTKGLRSAEAGAGGSDFCRPCKAMARNIRQQS
jgi:hypothetical protein